jgi:hypothetical protein
MKYTYSRVCPRNRKYVSEDDVYCNGGVCVQCGHQHQGGSTISHYDTEIGQWVREGYFGRKWVVMK